MKINKLNKNLDKKLNFALDNCLDFQRPFLESIREQYKEHGSLSEKQIMTLKKIIAEIKKWQKTKA